jgi:8-oxo-dGTP diphosphatase
MKRKELQMAVTYEYPRPGLAVDAAVFGFDDQDLKILLIQRAIEPFKGKWALPGGFVRMEESLEDAVRRELGEETGLAEVFLEQLYTFGRVNRDPRGRIVSVAYFALVKLADHQVRAATDARNAAWFALSDVPPLAFDHAEILEVAHRRLQAKVRYQPIGFELLPRAFTLSQLQHLYETILERPLDKRNFRKKILSLGGGELLKETGELEQDVSHRAARLFSFNQKKYQALERRGFLFEI